MYAADWSVLWSTQYGPLLLAGMLSTVKLTLLCLSFSAVIGLLVGLVRWDGGRRAKTVSSWYIEFARNTPPVVQILFWFFSASFLLPSWALNAAQDFGLSSAAVVIALSIYHGAFVAEVMRGSLSAIARGQLEAALTLGLGRAQAIRLILLPQALRLATPSLVNEAVSLAKNTSLAMAIGVAEVSYAAKYIDTYAFRGIEALAAATAFYLILCGALVGIGALVDHRLTRDEVRA
jgi:His/Glu/Gln/Arg/opine family amino acid ABC transporter permease subunit